MELRKSMLHNQISVRIIIIILYTYRKDKASAKLSQQSSSYLTGSLLSHYSVLSINLGGPLALLFWLCCSKYEKTYKMIVFAVLRSMDDNFGEWVESMGVASRRG